MSTPPRPLFHIPRDLDLPPLPGQVALPDSEPLAGLLEALIDAAGGNVIPAPTLSPDPPTIIDAFSALAGASADFEVAPGISLAKHFWTYGAAFHRGEVAASLHASARDRRAVHGFVALYVTDIRAPLLFGPSMRPFRIQGPVCTLPGVEGPFLALVACDAAPDGRAQANRAYAMPIYHARRFLPVRSGLDRDVLRALEHLQVALDAYGIECRIRRIAPGVDDALATQLEIAISQPGEKPRHLHITVDPNGRKVAAHERAETVFSVTLQNWANGDFVRWLKQVVPT